MSLVKCPECQSSFLHHISCPRRDEPVDPAVPRWNAWIPGELDEKDGMHGFGCSATDAAEDFAERWCDHESENLEMFLPNVGGCDVLVRKPGEEPVKIRVTAQQTVSFNAELEPW